MGKASVERLRAWFETGTCDVFAALETRRAALAGHVESVAAASPAKKEEGAEAKPALAASTAAAAAPPPPKEEPEEEENYGALAFA